MDLYFNPKDWSSRYGENIFTCHIVEGRPEISEGKYAEYVIEISFGDKKRRVQRRFSEFYALYCYLEKAKNLNCAFPPKTWFSCMDDDFIEYRRKALEKYLTHVLSISGVCKLATVRNFLQLE